VAARSRQRRVASVSQAVAQSRARLGAFARIYTAAGLILTGLVLYLVQVAHVTETSYQIQQLQSERADLLSQQEQLRYREANLQAPARLQQTAQVEGLQRVQHARYIAPAEVALDLGSAPQVATKPAPAWENILAAITGAHDAAAASRPR
jgi:hypothetical protein